MNLTVCSCTVYQGDCIENGDWGGLHIFQFKMLIEDAAKSRYEQSSKM
jgi:hypothetical protein